MCIFIVCESLGCALDSDKRLSTNLSFPGANANKRLDMSSRDNGYADLIHHTAVR